VDAGDQVEGASQQLQRHEPCDLGDLLVAVTMRVQPVEVRVADLGRRGQHLLGERDDRRDRRVARRALARELDLALRHPQPARRARMGDQAGSRS
jgi:hypothetical protein